jgi:hypothetical protein
MTFRKTIIIALSLWFIAFFDLKAESRLNLEILGAARLITVEDTDQGFNRNDMDYQLNLQYHHNGMISEKLEASGGIDVKLDPIQVFTLEEVHFSLKKEQLKGSIGRFNISGENGIVQGHRFAPTTLKNRGGYYGNRDQSQPNLAVFYYPTPDLELAIAYSTRQEDISIRPHEDRGIVNVVNLMGLGNLTFLRLGLEYEIKSYTYNDTNVDSTGVKPDQFRQTENNIGLGLEVPFLKRTFVPFLNLGHTSETDLGSGKIADALELNLGIDILLLRALGITVAVEQIRGKEATIQRNYVNGLYKLSESVELAGGYWQSNQKTDDGYENIQNQIDLEIRYRF